MATVYFSKTLIEDIECRARGMMAPAIQRAYKQKPDNSWGQRIYDILFSNIKPIASRLPNGWLKQVEEIAIDTVADQPCGLKFNLPMRQPWPYVFVETELAVQSRIYDNYINLKAHPVWDEFLTEVTAYHRRIDDAVKRSYEFTSAVRKICCSHATLAQALKVWPPLWDLLPDDVKARHHAKRREVKKCQESEVLDVDIEKLTAMSAAAKLGL